MVREAVTVRRATTGDADILVDLRVAFLAESGGLEDEALVRRRFREYLIRSLPAEEFIAWVATEENVIIATGAMTVYERPSWDGAAREGYVLNMYTVPERRRAGLGTAILEAMLDYAKIEGLRLGLIALPDARGLYERHGFKHDLRYMRWR